MTLYAEGQLRTLNLVGRMTLITYVDRVISPMVCCISPLTPTRVIDFMITSLSSRPMPSSALLNRMFAKLQLSSSTHFRRQSLC